MLYLLHGAGDIESGWTMIGRANNILDNLIAEGKAQADGRRHAARPRDPELLDGTGEAVADPIAPCAGSSLDDITPHDVGRRQGRALAVRAGSSSRT